MAALPANGSCDANPLGPVTALYQRPPGRITQDRSSVLFMFFAQWFTDSFLRTEPVDRRKNTSNHKIDLCQIYGLTETTTRMLRAQRGGKLASQMINGEEYPDYLYETNAAGQLVARQKYS